MALQSVNWKKSVILGAVAGAVWGWLSIGINAVSGAFSFEQNLSHHLVTFAVGGAVFGIVVSGLLIVMENWLPFKSSLVKAVWIATVLWIVLFMGAYGLALTTPDRYHFNVPQAFQGLLLAAVLGIMLGSLWKRFSEKSSS